MSQVVLMCGQQEVERFPVAEGTSLHQVMLTLNPETGNWAAPTICVFGGQPVLRAQWETTLLRGDDVAVFAELPMGGGGGGSNPMQMVFMAAVIVASIYTAGLATAAFAGPAAVAAGTVSATATAVGAMAGAAVTLAGSIISSAIFSSSPSGQSQAYQAEAASPTYSINGSSNQARLYQPIPEGFGRMRITPDIAANQWAQYIGNDMYLYQVFGCGRGSYRRESMSFADVKFWENGKVIESALTSASGEQYVNSVNATLKQVVDGGGWYGPYAATGILGLKISATIRFPDGLSEFTYTDLETDYGPDGRWKPVNTTASFILQYRAPGEGEDRWTDLASASITKAGTQEQTLLLEGTARNYGEWEVRIRNTSEIPDNSISTVNGGSKANLKKAVLSTVTSLGPSITVQEVEPGDTVTLFPDNVETSPNVSSQELLGINEEDHDWVGPFPINTPGTQITRAMYNFVFLGGLGEFDKKGKLKNRTVSIEIQHRAIDDQDNPLGEWETVLTKGYRAGTQTALRYTEEVQTAPGRYLSRVRKTSTTSTGNNAMERLQWESMTGIIPGSLTYPQTVVAIKIKATNTLSQSAANNFAVVQTRNLPLYDRKTRTWSEPQPTRSFAAALSWVCKAPYGGGLVDRQIDLDTLWRIDEELQTKNWNYDAWIDGPYNVWTLVLEMCKAVRVVPRPASSVLSFIMDKAGRQVRHAFSPRDIVRGSFVPTWNTFEEGTPDDVIVTYLDEDAGYLQRTVRAVLPESESRQPSTQTILGITNRDHAHELAVFMAACNRWRRLGCEFETEGMGRMLQLGDVISISHPRFRDTASGILSGWDANALMLRLESPLSVKQEGDLYMSLTRRDGTPWGPVKLLWVDCNMVRFDPEDYAALILQGMESPFTWLTVGDDRMPTVWTLQRGREHSRRYIVTNVQPQSVYRCRVTCINDSDKVDAYDIPTSAWEHRSNLPDFSILPAPGNLRVTLSEGTAETGLLTAAWTEVPSASAYEVEIGADGVNWTRFGRVNANTMQMQVAYDDVWFRVSTVRGNQQSLWSTWQGTFDLTEEDEDEAKAA